MAELWKLPVVYVIENNQYAMGTSVERSSAQTDLSKRGSSFNIPGEQVDGMDVRAVKAAGEKAVAWCRAGKGPIILEMKTYRYRGHSMSDPAKYRTREEVDKVRNEHDPIEQCARGCSPRTWATEDELKAIDAEVRAIVTEAAEFATHDAGARSGRALYRRLSLNRSRARARLNPHADPSPDAGALAHDGGGQARQMAEGRATRSSRRRHRRDRDRQGDHGGRGGRRGHARQDPGAGRHRGREGQHPDRHASWRTARTARCGQDCAGADQPKAAKPPPPAAEAGAGSRPSRRAAAAPPRRGSRCPRPTFPPAPRW